MAANLRLVGSTGTCAFCLRVLPVEDLRSAQMCIGVESRDDLICEDMEACLREFERQERLGWKDHVQIVARPA